MRVYLYSTQTVQRQLQLRPPEYAEQLRQATVRVAPEGWYIDVDHPAFKALQRQYQHQPPNPNEPAVPVDVVIPLSRGSQHNDLELRYALRSIRRYLRGVQQIWLIGHKPDWVEGVRHLPAEDDTPSSDRNIMRKLLLACQQDEVAEQIIFWSDDQVVLVPIAVQQMGPWAWGEITPDWQPKTHWHRRLKRTADLLRQKGLPTYHCDTHIPVPYRKAELRRVLEETRQEWDQGDGVCVNTWVCNHLYKPPVETVDGRKATIEEPLSYQEIQEQLQGRWFLGYNDAGFTPELRQVLYTLFPAVEFQAPLHTVDITDNSILPGMQRNLIYHVYPVATNTVWKDNIRELVQRWHVFNGKKIIGIVLDPWTVSPAEVQRLFPDDPAIEWLVAPNDPVRGEAVTFLPAANRLKSLDPREVTFYAHAKGVASQVGPGQDPHRWHYNIYRWVHYLYHYCLDCPLDWLDLVLHHYPCAGVIHRMGYRLEPGRPPARWHYAGNFWWIHHSHFFAKPDALCLGTSRWALERHLGELFDVEQAFALDGIQPEYWQSAPNMYCQSHEWWNATWQLAEQQQNRLVNEWRKAHQKIHVELHIVTPVSRPDNLPKLEQSIQESFRVLKPLWHLVVDPTTPRFPVPRSAVSCEVCGISNPGGHSHRNIALDRISHGWIFMLDDDTIIHPNLESVFLKALADFPSAQVIVVQQVDKEGRVRLHAHPPVRLGAIDTGSAIVRREFIEHSRFDWERTADGRWYEQLYNKNPDAFVFIDQPASYYNALR
jgi:hypothetical protein